MTKLEIAIQALKDIEDPISALRRNLKPDEQLDGRMAVSLSEDSTYLKATARQALNEIECGRK